MTDRPILQRVMPAVFIAAAVLVSTVRPLPRFHGRGQGHSGVNRLASASEPTERSDNESQRVSHERAYAAGLLTVILIAPVLVILKARRGAFVPLMFRHLKIPPAPSDPLPQ